MMSFDSLESFEPFDQIDFNWLYNDDENDQLSSLGFLEEEANLLDLDENLLFGASIHSSPWLDEMISFEIKEEEDLTKTIDRENNSDYSTASSIELACAQHLKSVERVDPDSGYGSSQESVDWEFKAFQKFVIDLDYESTENGDQEEYSEANSSSPTPEANGEQEKRWTCGQCPKSYKRIRELRRHLKVHTKDMNQCQVCSKVFTSSSFLRRHERSHTGERPFQCGKCDARFVQKSDCTRHMIGHTGHKPFLCPDCGKDFARQSQLKMHMQMHTSPKEKKAYQCNLCPSQYSHQGGLTAHSKLHTGKNLSICRWCEKKFISEGHLQAHERTHTGEKPFKCELCDKRFAQKGSLNEHRRTHKGERPFKCQLCLLAFTRSSGFNKHMRRKHLEQVPPNPKSQ